MLEQLVIVDYQEGAGGEFLASFVSAHWGHDITPNPQSQGNRVQKWLNSHSLVRPQWDQNFELNFAEFITLCEQHSIKQISVPYHLYKWPDHCERISNQIAHTRFVQIDVSGYLDHISADFRRKVLRRRLHSADFGEIKFFLQGQNIEHQRRCMNLFRQGTLTLVDIRPEFESYSGQKTLPSRDIKINYGDFFVDFDRTPAAYQQLCENLNMTPNPDLLQQLIDRNRKNLQAQQEYLSTLCDILF